MNRIVFAVATCSLLLWSPAQAQHVGADSVHHRNNCRLASQVLTEGHPANKREWALGYILRCGSAGGDAIAEVIRRHRHDESRQPALEAVVMLTTAFRDSAIFHAALEVAADPTAGKAARVQAFRTVFFQITDLPFHDPYESFLSDADLTYVPLSHGAKIEARPLPSDAAVRARAVADAVAGSDEDRDIRAAAEKVRSLAGIEMDRAGGPGM